MKANLPNHVSLEVNEDSGSPTADEVVQRLDALWAEDREQEKASLPTFIPQRIGRYDVKRLIGRGSFGIVCLARDELLDRDVAVKLPRPEVLEDDERMQRFESEARITAGLDHPGIVPLYEAQLDGDYPYLASAYCPGPDLGEWILANQSPVPVTDAVRLVGHLASAVGYAHEHDVVHRDLKPTNVLLQPTSSEPACPLPLDQVVPKITDFGLAKSFGSDFIDTRSSVMVGTPLYMAPEQVDHNCAAATDPAVDVYALGCILFELITGRTPIQGDTYVEIVDGLRNTNPPKLRTLRPEVSRDLENICGKCIEKLPADRYASVTELADDLNRFLQGDEVLARPIPLLRRIYRSWVRRPLLSGLVALVTILLFASLAIGYRYLSDIGEFEESLLRASSEVEQSRTETKQLNASLANIRYADNLSAAYEAFEKGDYVGARGRLLAHDPMIHGEQTFAWRLLDSLTVDPQPLVLRGHEGPVREVALLQNTNQLVSVGDDGTIRFWDYKSGELLDTIQAAEWHLSSLAISPDGSTLATGNTSVALWNLATKQSTPLNLWFDTTVEEIAFSEDGTRIVCGARNRGIKVLSLANGERVDIESESGNESLFVEDGLIYGIHSPRSTRVLCYWDLLSGKKVGNYKAPASTAVGAAALANKRSLFAIRNAHNGEVVICDRSDGSELWRSVQKAESYSDVTFSPDDALLLAGRKDGALCIWKVGDCLGEEDALRGVKPPVRAFEISAHEANITSICCADDGFIATASEDGTIKVWPPLKHRYRLSQLHPDVHQLITVPGSDDIGLAYTNGDLERLDLQSGATPWRVDYPREQSQDNRRRGRLQVSKSGDLFATFGRDYFVDVYDAKTGTEVFRSEHENRVMSVDFSPDDLLLAATGVDGFVSVWEVATGKEVSQYRLPGWGMAVRFSPSGRYLALGGRVPETLLVNTDDWSIHGSLPAGSGSTCIAFDPIRAQLATGHRDGVIRFWDISSCEPVAQVISDSRVTCLAYHPDDGTLVSGGGGGVALWDTRTRRHLGMIWPKSKGTQTPKISFTDSGEQLLCLFQRYQAGIRVNGLLVLEAGSEQ